MSSLVRSVSSVSYLTALLLLFMFICALMGMQLFGYKFAECTVRGWVWWRSLPGTDRDLEGLFTSHQTRCCGPASKM